MPPFIKFLESLDGIVFIDELKKTERSPTYTSLFITFVNYLSVADLLKLRLLNTYTYYASMDHQDSSVRNKPVKNTDVSFFHKTNFGDMLKYMRRMGNLDSSSSHSIRLHFWEQKLLTADVKALLS